MSVDEDFSVSVDWPLQGLANQKEVAMPIFVNNGEETWWAVATASKETTAGQDSLVLTVQKGRYLSKAEAKWAVDEFIKHHRTALEKLMDISKVVAVQFE